MVLNIEHIFREYDIRGIYNQELNEENVKKIGFLLGRKISKFGNLAAIGYDARLHSEQIAKWLISGLNRAGLKVLLQGLVPTPVNYFASFTKDINASVMITGSHNPPEYNGFKITINKLPFFGKNLQELSQEFKDTNIKISDDIRYEKINTKDEYIEFLTNEFLHLKGMDLPFVVDCANGTAGVVLPKICQNLKLNATFLYETPDGNFPNHHPDPSEEKNLVDIKKYLENEANLGFAFDGDSDRIAVLTKKYNIKGDILAILYSKNIKNPKVLGEVKCSKLMYDECAKTGEVFMGKTGHSNIKIKMNELNIGLAAEVSGHIFFKDRYFGYDDAIYAMLRFLELIKLDLNIDEEIQKLPKLYSTEEIKIPTIENLKFSQIKKLKEALKNPPENFPQIKQIIEIDGIRIVFEHGWGLIRASNTTPVLVARYEANSKENMLFYQNSLEKLINFIKEDNNDK